MFAVSFVDPLSPVLASPRLFVFFAATALCLFGGLARFWDRMAYWSVQFCGAAPWGRLSFRRYIGFRWSSL